MTTFENEIRKQVDEIRKLRFANTIQLTLGELIGKLENIAYTGDEPHVCFDFGYFYPAGLCSWRGSYNELSIEYSNNMAKEPKLTEFISILKDAIGKQFTGWKGGEYIMSEYTPIWVSNEGEACETAVIDVLDCKYKIVLQTAYQSY
jgi:hypothetical protein